MDPYHPPANHARQLGSPFVTLEVFVTAAEGAVQGLERAREAVLACLDERFYSPGIVATDTERNPWEGRSAVSTELTSKLTLMARRPEVMHSEIDAKVDPYFVGSCCSGGSATMIRHHESWLKITLGRKQGEGGPAKRCRLD
mmetsp:Transcript_10102/g.35308  ORF Transcript_10102/g.35308 Transcript_10102/m.35308 type:complete len:142 (-) Transcript_10102:31-456(-)